MKGNMLLGHARGSVGDVTFTRYNGQQIAYSRSRQHKNPKTEKQCLQRALFCNQVKFFTRGTQNLFKFAYENKRKKESDFNAFMRNNKNEGVMISRNAFAEPSYPAIGNWLMSYGSLPSPEITTGEGIFGEEICFVVGNSESGNMETVGDLSSAILAHYKVKTGDIVTFVQIVAFNSSGEDVPSIAPLPRGVIEWRVNQIRLDPFSKQNIGQAMPDIVANYTNTEIFFETYGDQCIAAAAVIFSRDTPKGLLASTSRLVNNVQARYAIETCETERYIRDVIESWKAEPNAILQGSAIARPIVDPLTNINFCYGAGPTFVEAVKTGKTEKYGTLKGKYKAGQQNYIVVTHPENAGLDPNKFSLVNGGTTLGLVEDLIYQYHFLFMPPASISGEIYIYYEKTKLWTILPDE